MVLEWNDEFGKVILREQVNSEPYEVIDIVDLLEAWEWYKCERCRHLWKSEEVCLLDECKYEPFNVRNKKPHTEVEVIACPIIDDDAWIYKDEPQTERSE